MRRREFITVVSSSVACPLAARAQQSAMPVVGFLSGSSPDTGRLEAWADESYPRMIVHDIERGARRTVIENR
jgi:hypothetical protein